MRRWQVLAAGTLMRQMHQSAAFSHLNEGHNERNKRTVRTSGGNERWEQAPRKAARQAPNERERHDKSQAGVARLSKRRTGAAWQAQTGSGTACA